MTISGMTGFARVEGAHGAWTWAVEARSVNGRNLEARFRGPPGFDNLERVARDGDIIGTVRQAPQQHQNRCCGNR